MDVGSTSQEPFQDHYQKRWANLRKFLERSGPFCHPDFEPSSEVLSFVMSTCKVLVVGAGGLGCELLKNLALMGFRNIDVIDMDTIDLSNLNRQFLFRRKDIGSSKAEVAAKFINDRIPGCKVTPHFKKIQDMDEDFYRSFHVVICGLDSVVARRWLNGMIVSLVEYNMNGELDQSSLIPLLDGGTEGFKGNARVILPGITPCIECTLDLFPPQVTYPLCTIANTPRLPEHCIEYVKVIQWVKENPFDCALDGDDPQHLTWLYERSLERANQFNISGVTYRLVQGVVKNIIPAVASTNAAIAAVVAVQAFKVATSCCLPLDNYLVLNQADGVYTYTYAAEKRASCVVCGAAGRATPLEVEDPQKMSLQGLMDRLTDPNRTALRSPALTLLTQCGTTRTLYMPGPPMLEAATRPHLKKTLAELGIGNGSTILVADPTTPNTIQFSIRVEKPDELME